MIIVTAPLTLWSGQGGRWHFITVPPEQSDEIRAQAFAMPRGFGSVRVEARIDGILWQTSIFPQKSGGYVLPVKIGVRKRAAITSGDDVTVSLEII